MLHIYICKCILNFCTIRAKSITNGTDVISMIDTIDPETPTGLQLQAINAKELKTCLEHMEREILSGKKPHWRNIVAIDLNLGLNHTHTHTHAHTRTCTHTHTHLIHSIISACHRLSQTGSSALQHGSGHAAITEKSRRNFPNTEKFPGHHAAHQHQGG